MVSKTVRIVNRLGLHARPSARIVQVASKFKANITLEKDGVPINGKSIMGVMMLAAGMGSEVTITTQGVDEEEALKTIAELLVSEFDLD